MYIISHRLMTCFYHSFEHHIHSLAVKINTFYMLMHQWLCTAVAAVLHYLFLSVFFWMLAEGIMLYILIVRPFSTAFERWYYLIPLGWGQYSILYTGLLVHVLEISRAIYNSWQVLQFQSLQ